MVEPKIMVQNILTTKRAQDKLSNSMGGAYRKMVCFECTEIHDKLIGILSHYNLRVGDIVPE